MNGPSAAGKTEVLQNIAETTPDTSLLNAAGLSTEEVMDNLMQILGVAYGDYRDADVLIDDVRDQRLSHIVLVTNTQWAGRTRSTTEPRRIADLLARGIGSPYMKTGVKVILEVDSSVHPLSTWIRSPLTLPPRPDAVRLDVRSLSVGHRTAVRALALAEPRSLRFEEWATLCSVLGAECGVSELQAIADELECVSVDDSSDLPVALTHESNAYALRSEVPTGEFRAFHHAVVDRLFACGDDDPLTDYLARALPAHAAAAGRFEELLSAPRTLTRCAHPALVEALAVAFPDGIPAGTFAADLHYLDKLGVAPSSHAEWLSILHLLALSQGDPERAHTLTESADPLPWRTVWTNWRAPGRLRSCGPHIDAIDGLRADAADSTVTSLSENGEEQTWHAVTGQLAEPGSRRRNVEAPADSRSPQTAVWRAEPSWNIVRLQLTADPSVSRVVQAPKIQSAACVGDFVVLGGDRGLYAIEPNPHQTESNPLRPLPAVGPRGKITPRPFDEAACRPTRARLRDIFNAQTAPTLTDEQLPSGLTHEPTRRFLNEIGFPAISDFYSLDTHHLLETGLVEHTWEGTKEFETPVGDGPFYELGTWIGGTLLLDGPTGRVLRQSQPGAVDDREPGAPLAGSSLASFVAMVCLQWEYMLAYTTSGGLDSADLLAELTAWLSGLDPAAAATRNWGHVLDSDNFSYL
ncbi:SUKH-4 family immunity protein [Streptomyces sp. NBC_01549]|uniref:SUKH-4 family immunity protein n=1 Tax=Streptomyces sp. NBC_01549 TaxID=2975874 RepID=UPI00224DD3FF|nr:SUKH-4 family immunity protein [Streptomyces sp. NBC_01549]MCX4588808.1 SUKH-4 family immunity protein [Streptomyces sp. NBC_01549]